MDGDILGHDASRIELYRLTAGGSRIEFERTKELLERLLGARSHLPTIARRSGRA